MKKDFVKRALCLLCCLTLTLGAFAYRPTKAEAVFVSPAVALGASLLASVVVGTTAAFFVNSGGADALGNAIDGLVREYIASVPDLVGYTADTFFGEIATGSALLENGAIQFSTAAGDLTARFINWLQGERFADGVTEVLSSGYPVAGPGGAVGSLSQFYSFDDWSLGSYVALDSVTTASTPAVTFPDGSYLAFRKDSKMLYGEYFSGGKLVASNSVFLTNLEYNKYDKVSVCYYYDINNIIRLGFLFCTADNDLKGNKPLSVCDIAQYPGAAIPLQEVSCTPSSDPVILPPSIPTNQSLVINHVGSMYGEDDQTSADNIMAAILSGTLAPSVSIEAQATDIPGTDTDEDEEAIPGAGAELLDWTKYIAQKVAAIPQAIADSIAQAVSATFAPDPVLLGEITGAFSDKFGFVEELKQVGDDLFGMTASSVPPVVWIHLEDAEGKYNYGGTVKALDMSWYQRYKAEGDRVVGGFLWIAYLWLLFKRLPDIIGGAGMVAADGLYVDEFRAENGDTFKFRRSKRL